LNEELTVIFESIKKTMKEKKVRGLLEKKEISTGAQFKEVGPKSTEMHLGKDRDL
jgi:hypothetical protein